MKVIKNTDWMDNDELSEFINENQIPRDCIQAIVNVSDDHFVMWYWVKS